MKKNIISITSIIVSIIIGIVALPYLPDQVAIHWGPGGEADGFASKIVGTFLLSVVMVLLLFLKAVLPKIDPKKKNYEHFSKSYNLLMELIILFMLVIQIVSILINLGYNLNIEFIIGISTGILFIFIGNYLPKIKHNYFMGIRTPWTLSNEIVWKKTHRLGGKAFIIFGALIIGMLFTPIPKLYGILIPTLLLVLSTTIASYIYHRQETK